MSVPFTRQLGPRSGVQLNPIIDNSERFVGGNSDQVFGTVGRFERGRIDKAFRVNRGNLFRMLGQPTSATVNRLNETLIHLYEALSNGAYEAVVYRLNVEDAVLSYMVAKNATVAGDVWAVEATPTAGYLVSVKHLECFNEGVRAEIHGVEKLDTDGTTKVATKEVKLRLKDLEGNLLYEFAGSLDPLAKDEFGASRFLPQVVAALTDAVEVTVPANAEVLPTSPFYGKDTDGNDKYQGEDLVYFAEGGTGYTSQDVDRACAALKYSDASFGYLTAGASRSVTVISKLIALGKDINKQCLWDVPGDYSASAAITFYNQLNVDTHYSQAYWAPLYADDPLNGGKDFLGTSGINVGLRCGRNARTDANGIPPKNFVVAGKDWPLSRTGIVQKYTPTEQELDDLARARINPVLFERYNSGSRYVFVDSLTGAKTEGDKKLIAVADMSSQVDDWVAAYAKEVLQRPMETALKQMRDFVKTLFEALEAAKWIKPSKELGDRSFVAEVLPNAQRPSDRMDVNYWLKYDGTVRAIYIQQTISK